MLRKLGFITDLVVDLVQSKTVPRFTEYTGMGFSLRRSRQSGAETVWFDYEAPGLSVEIQGEEGTDGGILFRFDLSTDLLALNDGSKQQIADNINLAMREQHISCQVILGNRVL